MIKRIYRNNFAKFEAKKRAKLSDKAFLEKYIPSFIKSSRTMKILLPILLVLYTLNAVLLIVSFATASYDGYRLAFMILWIIATLCWAFLAFVYYTHHFKFHAEKVKEWTEELNKILLAEQTALGNYIQNE